MKTIWITLFLAFLLSFIIIGCSDDNTIIQNQTEQTVFSLDSFGIKTNESGNVNLNRDTSTNIDNTKMYRIEFDTETNIDESAGMGDCDMKLILTTTFTTTEYIVEDFNSHKVIDINFTGLEDISFNVTIYSIDPIVIKEYGEGILFFRNIKVYVVN